MNYHLVKEWNCFLQAEEEERTNNRFERLLKNARFRYQASVEEIN